MTAPVALRAAGVGLVVDVPEGGLPRIVHWGSDPGDLSGPELKDMVAATTSPTVPTGMDSPVGVEILPQHALGWFGLPGVQGHRDGRDWSPLFRTVEVATADGESTGGGSLTVHAVDDVADLSVDLEIRMEASGLVRLRAHLRNCGDSAYQVDGVVLSLPLPAEASDVVDTAGRWSNEGVPQRRALTVGCHVRDGRRGRPGHDGPLLLAAGTPGFSFRAGQVWAVHVAWSGNRRTYVERVASGATVIGGGELLMPGEIRLDPGTTYSTPWLMAAFGMGLDEVSARFHSWLRSRSEHPRAPRPVVLNTWEAVYFDHDLGTLSRLADRAADVGVERFVLDDGWFRGRRHERAGLGDWYVDPQVWPRGLHPLVDHVRSRGMQVGLWVEPEMVNPDSDLARAHPDWILATGGRMPVQSRHQQVLDLAHPEAYAYILARLDALVGEYSLDYLKWDHNRDLVDAGRGPNGEPGVHAQIRAVYSLIDELRSRHPGLEIESCSSGGARIDLEMVRHTDRFWTSDTNDALDRQQIQRWTGLLVPPELMGAHIGPPTAHTTGRSHSLDFRAGTALFGHLGIEWDIAHLDAHDLERLSAWVALYRRVRSLLHSGGVVRADHPDPSMLVHGVVAQDASHALFALVSLTSRTTLLPGRVRLPGLDAARRYDVVPCPPGDRPAMWGRPGWLDNDPTGAHGVAGAVLDMIGLPAPALWPETLMLLEVTAR